MRAIEARYGVENAMLSAITEENARLAIQCTSRFRGFQGEPRSGSPLRDGKNYLIVLNSLARKAAENGYVHPAHLDAVSGDFARGIESASGLADLTPIAETMIRRYCGPGGRVFPAELFSPDTKRHQHC
jgi:hypothetical protein